MRQQRLYRLGSSLERLLPAGVGVCRQLLISPYLFVNFLGLQILFLQDDCAGWSISYLFTIVSPTLPDWIGEAFFRNIDDLKCTPGSCYQV